MWNFHTALLLLRIDKYFPTPAISKFRLHAEPGNTWGKANAVVFYNVFFTKSNIVSVPIKGRWKNITVFIKFKFVCPPIFSACCKFICPPTSPSITFKSILLHSNQNYCSFLYKRSFNQKSSRSLLGEIIAFHVAANVLRYLVCN